MPKPKQAGSNKNPNAKSCIPYEPDVKFRGAGPLQEVHKIRHLVTNEEEFKKILTPSLVKALINTAGLDNLDKEQEFGEGENVHTFKFAQYHPGNKLHLNIIIESAKIITKENDAPGQTKIGDPPAEGEGEE